MADYIERHKNVYRAALDVPEDVREIIGRRRFLKSLNTSDPRKAKAAALPYVSAWKAAIRQARAQLGDHRGEPDALIAEALRWRNALQTARDDSTAEHHGDRETVELLISEWVDDLAEKIGVERAHKLGGIAIGAKTPIRPLIATWASEHLANTVAPKTAAQYTSDLTKFVALVPTVEEITRAKVNEWITGLTAQGKDKKTVQRIIGAGSNFWVWLQDSGRVSLDAPNPFAGHRTLRPDRRGNGTKRRLPFTPDDLRRLHSAALDKPDQPLADLIELGAYTGARIEELCDLRKADVTVREGVPVALMIREGKTHAAVRDVPVHPKIRSLIERLMKDSTDGYLIPSTAANKYDKRSAAISKRFGHLKTKLKFTEQHVFHSIRHTVTTLLENAHVPENVAADILGHKKPRITYGHYGHGTRLEIKAEALARIEPMADK